MIQMYSSPGLNVGGIGGVTFLIGIYTASLPECMWVSDCDWFQTVDPAGILNLGDLCMLW